MGYNSNLIQYFHCQAFLCYLSNKESNQAAQAAISLMKKAAPHLQIKEKTIGKFNLIWWSFINESHDAVDLNGNEQMVLIVGEFLTSPYEPYWEQERFNCPPAEGFSESIIQNDFPIDGVHGAFALIYATKESIHVLTDMHGWQHVYKVSSISEGQTLAIGTFPGLLLGWIDSERIDPIGLVEILYLGYPTDERTLWQELTLLKGGTLYEWKSDGYLIFKKQIKAWEIKRAPDLGAEDYANEMQRVLEMCLKDWISGEFFLSLSGGKDSRVLLGTAIRLGLPVETFSYGDKKCADVKIACNVAKHTGVPWFHLPLEDDLTKDLEAAMGLLAGTMDCHFLWYFSMLKKLKSNSNFNSIMLGFIGDTLSGAHQYGVLRYLRESKAGIDIYKALALKQVNLPIEEISNVVSTKLLEEWTLYRKQAEELHGRINIIRDWHKYVSWELKQRQRRYITIQRRLSQLFFQTKIPFADARFIAFCESLPIIARENQLVYNELIKQLRNNLDNIELAGKTIITPRMRFLILQYLEWILFHYFRISIRRPFIFDRIKMAKKLILGMEESFRKTKCKKNYGESESVIQELCERSGDYVKKPMAVFSLAGVVFSLQLAKKFNIPNNSQLN
jgi:hypothetical protein